MFMNFFRIAGDMCHLLSFVVMFWKLHSSQSVAGVSLKTQELYVIVFVARYLDLFWNFLSIYNWVRRRQITRVPHQIIHTMPAPEASCLCFVGAHASTRCASPRPHRRLLLVSNPPAAHARRALGPVALRRS